MRRRESTSRCCYARNRLIGGFDGVLTNYFDCLVPLRFKVLPSWRVEPCLRLLEAVPLADTYTLRSRPHGCNDLSSRPETTTTGGLLRGLHKGTVSSGGRGIEHLTFADDVGFRDRSSAGLAVV